MFIYHIVMPDIWEISAELAEYSAESLESEGFIHCSFAPQVDAVLKRYYSGVEEVVILEIEPAKLKAKYVEERSTNDEIYPHIYGPINLDAVVAVSQRRLTN